MNHAMFYKITEEGKDWAGISRLIDDWTQHLCKTHQAYPFGNDEEYVIVFHPAIFAEVRSNSADSWSGLRVPQVANLPDSTPNLPIDRANVSVMNMEIAVSSVLNEDEMLIISKDMLELFDRLVHRATEESYHRGKFDGFREFHPQVRGASPVMDDAKTFDKLVMDAVKKIKEVRE